MRTTLIAAALALAGTALHAQVQVTIYNQGFATVKESHTLDLRQGENEARVSDLTAHLEPDSVVLRDLKNPGSLRILEQNYESDPLSEGLLLRKSEGRLLDFEITNPQTGEKRLVKGRILRSGYVPHRAAMQRYGAQYAQRQMVMADSGEGGGQPIVEVDGKVQFGLPGRPLFDTLDPKAFLKPTLLWKLWADTGGKHETELSYITGGMRWEATYDAVAPEKGDSFEIVGWVTLENMSGKDFGAASLKLMAGDVSRARPEGDQADARVAYMAARREAEPVSERAFEEYHLYSLPRPVTLLDREVKQVELLRAVNVPAKRLYVYDGFQADPRYSGWPEANIRREQGYGTASNPKLWVMLEFKNAADSRLGMPLPKGTVKLYRRDLDGRNEFIGEDRIDHTPTDETVRLYTGNAFDLVGERRQTSFRLDSNRDWLDESFEIKLRNHKKEDVEVRVVEHLYRWVQWDLTAGSMPHVKLDARTIEFRPKVPAGGESIVTYTVHYTW